MKSNKMIRLVCLVLLVSILLSSTVIFPSRAVFPPGFDSSRIRMENKIGHKVVLEFDQIKLYGSLTRQTPMSDEELKKLIEETMKELGIESLEKLNEAVEKAKQWDEITEEEISQFLEDLAKAVRVHPGGDKVGDAIEVLDKLRTNILDGSEAGGELGADMLKDFIIKLLVKEMNKRLIESDFLMPNDLLLQEYLENYDKLKNAKSGLEYSLHLLEFLNLLIEKYMQDQQKWKDRVEASLAKALLDQFYEELQKKIDKAKNENRDKGKWVIEFDKSTAQRHNFSFFGVGGNNQTWELMMRLEQTESTGDFSFESENVAGTSAGTYKGEYTLTTDSDLTFFAASPGESIMNIGIHGENMKWLVNAAKMAHPNNDYYAEPVSHGTARNIRTLKGSCSAYVLESGEIQLNIEHGREEIKNKFENLKIVINEVAHNGLNGEFLYQEAIDAEIKAIPDEKKVYIEYEKYGYFVKGNPKYDWGASIANLAEGRGIAVMFNDLEGEPGYYDWDDSEIWKPWDESIKTMRIVN
mgnify:CR=1 FL=1